MEILILFSSVFNAFFSKSNYLAVVVSSVSVSAPVSSAGSAPLVLLALAFSAEKI